MKEKNKMFKWIFFYPGYYFDLKHLKMGHPFHLVSVSPWPLCQSLSVMLFLLGGLSLLVDKKDNFFMYGFLSLIMVMFQWFRDIIRESSYLGCHTKSIVRGLKLGMILFIISEFFFFLSFFWSFFHFSLSPSIELGMIWPPKGLILFDPFGISLLNTVVLVSSGVSLTWSHLSLLNYNKKNISLGLLVTLILGFYFILMQMIEYNESYFTMSDSVYGSIFFLMTGFHGFHVFVGFIFLLVMYLRLKMDHFIFGRYVGFDFSCWYWHFVDVVWLFLYMIVYWWVY